jgi:2-hydroxychromene-2-carboxylate isomerase
MTTTADWYFDYLSPYPWLQMARFDALPASLIVQPRPVLFAALLNHWGQKGPAEIPAKARQTGRYTIWLAAQRGLPMAGPPRHPFNPLPLLRLTLALGSTVEVVRTIYRHVWGEGHDGQSDESLALLANKLGIHNLTELLADPQWKAELRTNTDTAIARGVYGVPTFAIGAQLFWGDDVTDMMLAWLDDRDMFDRPPYQRDQPVTRAAWRLKE